MSTSQIIISLCLTNWLTFLSSCCGQPVLQPSLPTPAVCCTTNTTNGTANSRKNSSQELVKIWRKSVTGFNPVANATIAPLYNYDFLVPEQQLRSSTIYLGAGIRLRKFVSDLLSGSRPLKVGVVGGSISMGSFAAPPETMSWFPLVGSWLKSVAKQGMKVRNGALGGTPSSYMVLCLDYNVDQDVDLVFVEYADNDGIVNRVNDNTVVLTMERLLRRILNLPGRPAVVMMQTPSITLKDLREYISTLEEMQRSNSAYYDVAAVSAKVAYWRLTFMDKVPGFEFNKLFWQRHPINAGHRVMADVAVHLLQTVAVGLLEQPFSADEQRLWAEPIPAPMRPGNVPPLAPACVVGDRFTPLVKTSRGFNWIDEGAPGKPKWGYVATEPGSLLQFEVNTVVPHLASNRSIELYMYYLASYTAWGVGLVECASGCSCEPLEVDAHIKEHNSQTHMVRLMATQTPQCRIQVTVLNKTTSAGHKFKVVGVVVTEQSTNPALEVVLLNRNPYDNNRKPG